MLTKKYLASGIIIAVGVFFIAGHFSGGRQWLAVLFGAGAVGPPIIAALVARLFDRLDRTLERASDLNADYYINVTKAISKYHKQLLDIWLQLIFCCFISGVSAGVLKYGSQLISFKVSVALGAASLCMIVVLLHNLRKIFLDEVSSRTDMSIKIRSEAERKKISIDLGNKLVAGI